MPYLVEETVMLVNPVIRATAKTRIDLIIKTLLQDISIAVQALCQLAPEPPLLDSPREDDFQV